MKNFFKTLIIALALTIISFNVFAESATGRPTSYKVTAYKLEYCAGASTLASCVDATTVGESSAGVEMDLVDSSSAVSFGTAGLLEPGKTYKFAQITIDREFKMTGTVTTSGAAAATCNTGGTDGSEDAGGATNAGAISEQVVAPPDGTGNGDGLNTVSAVGGTGTAGTFTDNDGFLQVRWELSSPFAVSAGKIPSISIAFDISAALVFNDGAGGDGACDGNDFYPGAPTISNTFSY